MGKETYNASSLKVLKGLEPVKVRPGMYIGSTDINGCHHLLWEIIDNAVDEARAGYGKKIQIILHTDGSVTVVDEGRGVPCDYNEEQQMYGLDIVFCTLHGGAKFESGVYQASGGLHGVGASCANALSEWLEVNVYKDGKEYHVMYRDGGTKTSGTQEIGPTTKRGTIVSFKPDKKVFSDTYFNFETICKHVDRTASQNSGVRFIVTDEREKKKEEFYYTNGISEFLEKQNQNFTAIHPIIYFKDETNKICHAEYCLQFLKDAYDEQVYSFANTIFTSEEGTHVRGFRSGLTKAFNEYALRNGIIKGNQKLDGNDIREGISFVVSVDIYQKLEFQGQVKEKLGNTIAAVVVENLVYETMTRYLIQNKEYAKKIFDRIMEAQKVRDAVRSAKDEARKQSSKDIEKTTLLLSGKLVPPQSKDYSRNELFIVEGDSAGGSAKNCRDIKTQGLLPLRGKPKNISNDAEDAFMKNEELSTLAFTIGTGTGKDFNIKNLHYDKIIIMTDADTDGSHIQNLLINFFYKKMKPLIELGHIYVACPPLYRVFKYNKGKLMEEFCWNEQDVEEAKKKVGAGYSISRFKGLGEMNADQLWKTTMDPRRRKLLQLQLIDDQIAAEMIETFMGKEPAKRNEWIRENIDFSTKGDFFAEEVKSHE